jgi:3D (Asp-Asp-Asp) domain-containing protein
MAIHLSGTRIALGLVVVSLITAFGSPRDGVVALAVTPTVEVLAEPVFRVEPLRPVLGPNRQVSLVVRATAYNSLEAQTNSQPFITATGERTRWGIVAVSRDLLDETLPYGSLIRLRDLGNYHNGRGAGVYQTLLDGDLFVVEDTMHPRKRNQIDVWFPDYASAVSWGVRKLQIEVVRVGRDGTSLDQLAAEGFQVDPRWLAMR